MVRIRVVQQDGYKLFDEAGPMQQASRFLEALQMRGLSPMTIRAYAYDLPLLYRWLERAQKKLEQLTAADLIEFIADQRNAMAEPRSINRRLTTIRLLFRFHTDRDLDVGPGVSLPSPYYK